MCAQSCCSSLLPNDWQDYTLGRDQRVSACNSCWETPVHSRTFINLDPLASVSSSFNEERTNPVATEVSEIWGYRNQMQILHKNRIFQREITLNALKIGKNIMLQFKIKRKWAKHLLYFQVLQNMTSQTTWWQVGSAGLGWMIHNYENVRDHSELFQNVSKDQSNAGSFYSRNSQTATSNHRKNQIRLDQKIF